jgi:hypothetical protein
MAFSSSTGATVAVVLTRTSGQRPDRRRTIFNGYRNGAIPVRPCRLQLEAKRCTAGMVPFFMIKADGLSQATTALKFCRKRDRISTLARIHGLGGGSL